MRLAVVGKYRTIPAKYLSHRSHGKNEAGLRGEYFNNIKLAGKPALSRSEAPLQFRWTLFSWYSVRWTGQLRAPQSGNFKIGIEGNDGYRLYLNNQLIIDNWRKQTYQTILAEYAFVKDELYDLKIEFFESVGNVKLNLVWNMEMKDARIQAMDEAVQMANQCDLAVVVAGIEEGEFRDRAFLNLPDQQEDLIRRIAATGKPVIVVLVGGSAITMENWRNEVEGILMAWYPGEAGGNAVAEVLFGDYNPAGRLPITFPMHEAQLPLYYNHKPTGRGDDYLNLTGQPLFPFGFGLSYTTFEYDDLIIEKNEIGPNESTKVHFKLTNTGNRAGDEVVQLYIKDLLASVVRPVIELKGFQRIQLQPGETKTVEFEITPVLLSMLDKNLERIVEPGDFKIMIGASSKDIRLRGMITVK